MAERKALRVPSPYPSILSLFCRCCSDNLLIYFGGKKSCWIIRLAEGMGRKSKRKQKRLVDFLSHHLSISYHGSLLNNLLVDFLFLQKLFPLSPHSASSSYISCPPHPRHLSTSAPTFISIILSPLLLLHFFFSSPHSPHLIPLLSLYFLPPCHYRDIIYEVLKMLLSELLCSVTKVTNM